MATFESVESTFMFYPRAFDQFIFEITQQLF